MVLLSGGMDSCVCAALAARDYEAAALHVSYGQRTEERERKAFVGICDRLGIRDRLMVRNDALRAIGGSALTDPEHRRPRVARDRARHSGHLCALPQRAFSAVAVSWAEVLGAEKVYIGAVEQDSSGYPDCRPAYYQAFNQVIKREQKRADRNRDAADCHAKSGDCEAWP